jgi:hypothetical protein
VYRRTQRSPATLALFAAACAALALVLVARPGPWPLLAGIAAVVAWAAWAFRSLTVEVADGELRAWFGSGWPRFRWPLDRVEAAEPVRTTLWEGVGIHFTSRGKLYNVATGAAVQVRLAGGARFMLGTGDADALAGAIRSAAGLPSALTHQRTHAPGFP